MVGRSEPVGGPVTRAPGRSTRESGAALAFVVLLMVGLLTLAHGLLVASLSELAVSRAAVRELRVRGAAELGVRRALGASAGPWMDGLSVGESRVTGGALDDMAVGSELRRIGAEAWVAVGTATSGVAAARAMRLAWAIDPLTRVTALGGMVSTGFDAPVLVEGLVDASAAAVPAPPLREEDCELWQDALLTRYAASPLSVVTSLPDTLTSPALGLVDFEALLSAAPLPVSGSGTPTPLDAFGVCALNLPWGWGEPDRPDRPCGAYLPIRAAADDLVVDGGVGQVLLVVDGDLRLERGARLYGLMIASGALVLEGASSFEGMAIALGGLALAPGSTLRASACWAVRALDAQRSALGGFLPVPGGRLGPF